MPSAITSPRRSQRDEIVQLSYEASSRIYTTKTYPVPSPNGSNILIQGNENGARIIWRGGRPFKPETAESPDTSAKTNGKVDDVIMIDDSDDESPPFEDKPEFEDVEADAESATQIVQFLDLNFGTSVLQLAVPPPTVTYGDASTRPGILQDKIVFAIACADLSIRLVTLPLTPPSPPSKERLDLQSSMTAANAGNGRWGETVLKLSHVSRLPSDGLSMTLNERLAATSDELTPVAGLPTFKSPKPESTGEWDILLASISRDITGLLTIHRIGIDKSTKDKTTVYSITKETQPAQTHYLPSPATHISFNPSIHHPTSSSHLLVTDSTSTVRILSTTPSLSVSAGTPLPITSQGSWLLSLYAPFLPSTSSSSHTHLPPLSPKGTRKPIIDTQWILSGRAILILLSDGEWGIWDITLAGPHPSSDLTSGRKSASSRTKFAVSGYLEGLSMVAAAPKAAPAGGRFAPMTPGTRKTAESGIFAQRENGTAKGGISVALLPKTESTKAPDESVVFWVDDYFAVIPNLRTFWEAKVGRGPAGVGANASQGAGNLFGAKPLSHMMRLNVNLRGQRGVGVEQVVLPVEVVKRYKGRGVPMTTELVVVGEQRWVVLRQEGNDGAGGGFWKGGLAEKLRQASGAGGEKTSAVNKVDFAATFMNGKMGNGTGPKKGVELGLEGIESALDDMAGDDEDTEMSLL